MTKNTKIIIFSFLFLVMLAMTIYASLHQNLFTEFSFKGSPEWFKATLVDFYINQFILWFWVFSIEKNTFTKILWLILFIGFGSMGTTSYIIIRLIRNKSLFKKE